MTEPESHYRDLLAKQVDGQIEVRLRFGRADVMTDAIVFEVEPITRWRTGAAQALQYAAQVPQAGALALYGNPRVLMDVFSEITALPPPGLELWWFTEDGSLIPLKTSEDVRACQPRSRKPPAPVPREPLPNLGLPPLPVPAPPPQRYNHAGLEVWYSTHLENGELRPELRGLSGKEFARVVLDHAPDPSERQVARARAIFARPGMAGLGTTAHNVVVVSAGSEEDR